MPNVTINAHRTRITQIVCGVFFVGAVLLALRSMMFGSFSQAGLVLSLALGGAVVFALDDKYWLLLPFLSISGFSIPNLPFNGTETGCVVLIGTYFVRLALKKGHPFRFDRDLVVAFPVLFWMFVVWAINPTGLAMFGSDMIGGRFYFDIAVGTVALFVLSTIRVSEREAKLLFFAILVAQLCVLVRGVIFPGIDPDALVFTGVEPERSARYSFIICSSIFMLLYAYWPLSSILASPLKIAVFALLALLSVYSGKRRAFGTIALIPFFRAFLTGREKLLTIVMAVLAAVFLVFAIAGDEGAYRLPRSARRALAVVAPQYQKTLDEGGLNDLFRREMREQARYVIVDDPVFGRKGFAMNLNETAWINFGRGQTSLFAGHAYSGNWHSTWYAYAADFGLPCMVFWLVFTLYVLLYSFHAARLVVVGQYLPACCLYHSIWFFVDAAFSYTTGHAAITTMNNFIAYGLLLSIVRGYRREHELGAT
ncbi:MAG: hypothetical protein II840_13670 [Kiritimatiellae bacterium]|nr:hypothetical protein [Kiritimatiellia bacterium]